MVNIYDYIDINGENKDKTSLSHILYKETEKECSRDKLVKLSNLLVFIQNEEPNKLVANDIFRIDSNENKIGYKLGCEDSDNQTIDNVAGTFFHFY